MVSEVTEAVGSTPDLSSAGRIIYSVAARIEASRIEYRHQVTNRLVRRVGFCFHRSRTSSVTTHVEGDGHKTRASDSFHLSLPTRPDRRKAVAKDDNGSATLLYEMKGNSICLYLTVVHRRRSLPRQK